MSEGVWAYTVSDYGESIGAVFQVEIEALRYAVEQGHGKVRFLPYGKTLIEMKEEE